MQPDLKETVTLSNAVFEKAHGDNSDLSPAINMDVHLYKILCFIPAVQNKIPELTFICSHSEGLCLRSFFSPYI